MCIQAAGQYFLFVSNDGVVYGSHGQILTYYDRSQAKILENYIFHTQ